MSPAPAPDASGVQQFVLNRYQERIDYYWKASRNNKRAYKLTRYLTVVLGALVTLISSLSSAHFVGNGPLSVTFAVLTPVFAATLAIVGGFSQSFQWGAAWSDGVLAAERLERERDRIAVVLPEDLDPTAELSTLNDITLAETRGFFGRILGSGPRASERGMD